MEKLSISGFSDFLKKSKGVDSIMEAKVLNYPDLFNIVFFKAHADLVKMGKISKVKNLTIVQKM